MEFITKVILKHPFTCMMAGPSKPGNTTLLYKILQEREKVFDKPPYRIVYSYTRWQDNVEKIKHSIPIVEFNQGLPDIDMFDSKVINLLILDDLMNECGSNKQR